MFWGLTMKPGKRYTQRVDESFHISQASLDVNGNDSGPVQIVLEYAGCDYIIATVSKSAKIYQVPLDLNFKAGDQISFRVAGPGCVHLSGYRLPEEDDLETRLLNGDSDDEEEEDEEEEEIAEVTPSTPPGKRKKKQLDTSSTKKSKVQKEESDSDEDSDEVIDSSFLDSEAMEPSDDDDEDDAEEEDDDDDDDEDEEDDESDEEEKESVSKKNKSTNEISMNGVSSSKKDKLVQSKNDSVQAKSTKPETPKSSKKQDGRQSLKGDNQKQEVTSPKGVKSPGTPGQKKVLQGGVISEEIKVGDGPVAKPGKFATVYYVGKLKSNNKQFDATTGGPGFKFRIGRGEVIKGWDIGVAGMKVGGKRRLTIPAGFAYGAKGSPPVIPPNSTLVFELELRGLS